MDEPRWLTQDEQDAWMSFATVLLKMPFALDAQLRRDEDISFFEYLVMAHLSVQPDRTLRMSDLATIANGSLSRLSHTVRRLEGRGWIRRASSPDNGRYTDATLTEAGWDKVVASAPYHVETVRDLVIDALSAAQIRQLRDISRLIEQRLEKTDLTPV